MEKKITKQESMKSAEHVEYLECERWWVFALLMFVAGAFGAYTYSIRGGVFCNAQTANFVLFAMALGNGAWKEAAYYLIPMSAYLLGAMISETMAYRIKKFQLIRWDTMFIVIEIIAVIFMGCLPETAPFQITQVIINFIASMQYNTFRQAESVPMATTFCTNHLRQTGVALCMTLRHREKGFVQRMFKHIGMLFVFVVGGTICTYLCRFFLGKAIWMTLIPLGILFIDLLYADLRKERGNMEQKPRGH